MRCTLGVQTTHAMRKIQTAEPRYVLLHYNGIYMTFIFTLHLHYMYIFPVLDPFACAEVFS